MKKPKAKIIQAILLAVVLGFAAFSFSAAVECADGQPAVNDKCPVRNPASQYLVGNSDTKAQDLVIQLIDIFLYFAGAIALIFLIVGGFQYIASRGNEEATEKAKKSIAGAVIGIVIIVMSYAIVTIVNNLLLSKTT